MFAELGSLMSDMGLHPGQVFVKVLPAILIGALVFIVLHLVLSLLGRRPARRRTRWNLWERLVYLAALGSVVVCGVTSFYGVLRDGTLAGWLLFVHMLGAGAFVFVLPVVAVTWCAACRFGNPPSDTPAGDVSAPRFFWLPKLMFWVWLAGGLVVSLAMLVSMLPLFGTDGLLNLLDVHRYSGLLVVVAVAFHFYGVLLQRLGLR